MIQKLTILKIIILLLEYPFLYLLKGETKKRYSKELKKKIQNLKKAVDTLHDLNNFVTELENLQKILNNFILTNQNELAQNQKLFLQEINNCLLQLKDMILNNANSKLLFEEPFSSFLEKLKQNQAFDTVLQISKNKANVWEKKASEATQYGSELNIELDRIASDVSNLLKIINTLKAKLTLEESRSEILTEDKKALIKELALEKIKKN